MEALLVIVVVLLAMRLVGALALVLVNHGRRRPPARPADPCLSPVWALPPVPMTDPEQALLDRLRTGEIGRGQYRAAIADIAHQAAAAPSLRAPAYRPGRACPNSRP
ncbi:hypothetical protein [Actinoplanes xinjiangensis]|uniref:Uncharacterized protein n=1 Tax=Actinoplanes xinjiangensis TaxID=512350 RepID=A0A316E7V8_9ACTN|nr:hypothetical protein [Actinoplanes xinjiangensis]PWK26801.1 hypothetical protein BC793_1601 [Actinoplanes xinjiangensis]GIF45364.1 hypothetical protein Axi01nite_96750 [Actinoplanes xinjiangensis]